MALRALPVFGPSTADANITILPDILHWRSAHQPGDNAFIFLADGENDEHPLTYRELDRRANAIASELVRSGATGSRALLVYDSGLDYIAALYACFYAGVIAVPVYPPDPFRVERTLPRLRTIVHDAGATWLLATQATLEWARPLFQSVSGLTSFVATDSITTGDQRGEAEVDLPLITAEQPALLQYTSGSTGDPRGVTITHANLIANLQSIHAALDREDNVAVVWLPAYHDMGLIGGIFLPVHSGRLVVFMSPVSFMQHPARWLKAMSRYRATITAAPNFAFDLCVRKVSADERAGLDLSSLVAVLNGAEMVRAETLHRFSEAFADCGFRPEAFYPCYGLAEATLMVAGGIPETLPVVRSFSAAALEENRAATPVDVSDARELVGCGHAAPFQQVAIVDPDSGQPLGEGQVGEIWVASKSIGQGYWNRPDESAATFDAHLADDDQRSFLRTGDLGFFDQGELFIVGRRKELIIIQGRNHYPHDIEETVWRSHPALKADGGAAFSVEVGGEERLAIVQEVMRPKKIDPVALIEAIRSQVAETHGVVPVAVTLIPAGTLPKTSSGKKQRRGCREQFLAGSLTAVGQWRDERFFGQPSSADVSAVEPRTETEKTLAELWSHVLGIEARDVYANFFDLGGQSLLASQLAGRIQEQFSVELSLRTLFANPTIASQATWLEQPRQTKAVDELPPLTRADRSQPLPLSSSQQQLWFLEQLESTPRYNLSASIRLQGPLDIEALRRSLSAIVSRHEALRTTFPSREGRPQQIVGAATTLPLEIVEAVDSSTPVRAKFDLSVGPLLRAMFERISTSEHRLHLTSHHLVCDGWSLAIFLRELATCYATEVRAIPHSLDDVEWQFADFAAWQQLCLATPLMARELDYWKAQLDGVQPLDLVTDLQRSADAEFHGAAVHWTIDEPILAALAELARREGATMFMVLLAAFQTLLARYSRQQDICVGSPVSYRPRPEFENSIGYFVNTLALRADFSGEPTFRQLLARVRETVLDALANSDAPLPAVVDAVAPRRDAARTPLFNVMFVFENLPWQAMDAGGVTIGEIEIDHTRIGSYDLGLVIEEQGGRRQGDKGTRGQGDKGTRGQGDDAPRLKASLVYNSELFDRATVESMAGAFRSLLNGLVADPDRPVMCVPLVVGWASRTTADHGGQCPPYLMSPCLPDAIAVVDGTTKLTYRELEERANQLAHYLQALGVGPEVPVAIFLDRSIEFVVALMAVLKAGGAYVPFDSNEATGRLEAMLVDTRPRAVITSERLAVRLPTHDSEEVLIDRDASEISRHPSSPPENSAAFDALAYIIYTSGSSGIPKGVEVSRGSLDNMVRAMADQYELSAGDRVLQLISPAFDVAAEEIFPALLRGAALVLGPPTAELTGRAILDVCRQERISVAHIPPQLWQQCLREWEPADEAIFEHLRVLVVGGEAPPAEALNRWISLSRGRVRVLYEFGLTETTVTNLVYKLPVELKRWPSRRKLPIGHPVAGTIVYLLDEHQQPVPVGAPGELYLGGPGLARGYHNLPEATQDRFVNVPVGEAAASLRLCRTGDLARWLPDGSLEFIGRIDQQIKLRGLRIEPGEIERALAQHPTVGEAAVVVREDVQGAKRLVAYLVPSNGHVAKGDELRAWLRRRLPDSMVPAVIMPLERLPLNRSHKLDRDALPAPPSVTAFGAYSPPSNAVEKILAEVWRDVLKVERVGIHDNFFELGGDSILTIQVVARAREAGLRFTPRQLFEHQTIAELAAVEGREAEPAAEQGPVEGDAPLTPVQQWFLSDDVIDAHDFNQSLLFEVDGSLDPRHLPQLLDSLVEQHDALRLRFARDAHGWRQWHGEAQGAWPLQRFDLSNIDEVEQPAALVAAAAGLQAGLNLEQGPLARAAWFELGPGQARLFLVIHHLLVDAVSWRILLDDLAIVWRQLQDGRPPALPPKSTSFKQWAERLTSYAASYELHEEVAFWRALADQPAVALPREAEGENLQSEVGVVSSIWTPTQTAELLNGANAAYRTQPNELLLAALGQSLGKWSAGRVLIAVEGHGRTDLFGEIDLARTVGWFASWHPHLSASSDLPAGALLRQTKEALRSVPNQGIGYGVLRYLSPKPEIRALMAGLPQPEISFNYLGRMDDSVASGQLAPVAEPVGRTRSPRARRSHLLEVNAYVLDGRLHVDWSYCRNLHRREIIERLAADFFDSLAALVEHCLSPDAGGYTPSDFPLARLNESELDKLAGLLGE